MLIHTNSTVFTGKGFTPLLSEKVSDASCGVPILGQYLTINQGILTFPNPSQ